MSESGRRAEARRIALVHRSLFFLLRLRNCAVESSWASQQSSGVRICLWLLVSYTEQGDTFLLKVWQAWVKGTLSWVVKLSVALEEVGWLRTFLAQDTWEDRVPDALQVHMGPLLAEEVGILFLLVSSPLLGIHPISLTGRVEDYRRHRRRDWVLDTYAYLQRMLASILQQHVAEARTPL